MPILYKSKCKDNEISQEPTPESTEEQIEKDARKEFDILISQFNKEFKECVFSIDRLGLLQKYAEIQIDRLPPFYYRPKGRKSIETKCMVCEKMAKSHFHHIIPMGSGGFDIDTNLIPLCQDCHALVHPSYNSLIGVKKMEQEIRRFFRGYY